MNGIEKDKSINIDRKQSSKVDEEMYRIWGEKYLLYRKNWNHAGELTKGINERLEFTEPINLDLEITTYCNLRCKMCFRSFSEQTIHQNMSMELVDKIVKEAKTLNIQAIMLGGGAECTLHPQFLEILEKLSQIPSVIDFIVLTNGTRLTEEVVEKILDLKITKVFVSLDAATEETYRNIRGGSLANVEKNIHYLIKRKKALGLAFPFLRVSFVEQEDNRAEKKLFYEKWKDIADIIDFQKYIDFSHSTYRQLDPVLYYCKDAFRRIFITADGSYFLCCKRVIIGNITSQTILECWNGEARKALVQSFNTQELFDKCKKCLLLEKD